ncbi:hypothetical protein SLEP1_g55387 [Rubroshorea leprosula]|uniref:Uncharacterized protein n=1 Tax=Rubroshorea leprosula TaxID=152421 RepID=A0AAV5MG58_9ROSI|nr:hypothetical protein SLEP1_g55387 [Rubroshorea leprosula]
MFLMQDISLTSSTRSRFSLKSYSLLSSSWRSDLSNGSLTSTRMTASAPYARLNGVSPVAELGVVRYDQSTLLSSSTQLECEAKTHALRPRKTILLADSACPFDCGVYTDVKASSMIVVAERPQCRGSELRTIVSNDPLRYAKPAQY